MDYKYGFHGNDLSTDNIFYIRLIFKKWKNNDAVHQLFLGFRRAYDSVMGEVLRSCVTEYVKLLIL